MHSFAHHHSEPAKESVHETRGLVMNWGWPYDLMVWFFDTVVFHGKLQALRTKTADLAKLQRGEAVLDVGCGTGTQALKAYERVGETGRVSGIDRGPRQIARARAKAARRKFPIDFQIGVIEQLAFPDQSFDVVLSTLMMHHLPDDLKRQGLTEIARVLKPGGRLLIVDFKRSEKHQGRHTRLGAGQMGIQDLPALMKEAGFSQIESGEMDIGRTRLFKIGFVRCSTLKQVEKGH
jgi:ubiquinone/menaquinone biosynthesis C-methylase UbiE